MTLTHNTSFVTTPPSHPSCQHSHDTDAQMDHLHASFIACIQSQARTPKLIRQLKQPKNMNPKPRSLNTTSATTPPCILAAINTTHASPRTSPSPTTRVTHHQQEAMQSQLQVAPKPPNPTPINPKHPHQSRTQPQFKLSHAATRHQHTQSLQAHRTIINSIQRRTSNCVVPLC